MKLLTGPDDFPMYRFPGTCVPSKELAGEILLHVESIKTAELKDYAEYFRLHSKSAEPFAHNTESSNPLVRGWNSMFAGHILNGYEAVKVYRALADILLDRAGDEPRIYTVVPTYYVSIDTMRRHRVTSIKQDGVMIVAVTDQWKPEGIYYSPDVSTGVIGCSKTDVDQFIKIANHLNTEPEEE